MTEAKRPVGLWIALLAACAVGIAGCAGPRVLTVQENQVMQDALDRMVKSWQEVKWKQAEGLKGDPRDRFVRELGNRTAALAVSNVWWVHQAIHPGTYGYISIEGEQKAGSTVTVAIHAGPPGGSYRLFSSRELAYPESMPDEERMTGYWVLDRNLEVEVAQGELDERGDARVRVNVLGDPGASHGFLGFQAFVRQGQSGKSGGPQLCTAPAGGKIAP